MAQRFFVFRPFSMLAVIVLLGLSAAGARADLAIMGGTVAQQDAVRRAASTLPACCRTSCQVPVQLLDDQAMDAYLQAQAAVRHMRLVNVDSVDGIYQNSSLTVTLRTASPSADVSATLTHEYGHYVWFNILTPVQRDQYAKVYKAQRSAHHLVTSYAAVSVEEGFAEAFSFYARQHSLLRERDQASCDFCDAVFREKDVTH